MTGCEIAPGKPIARRTSGLGDGVKDESHDDGPGGRRRGAGRKPSVLSGAEHGVLEGRRTRCAGLAPARRCIAAGSSSSAIPLGGWRLESPISSVSPARRPTNGFAASARRGAPVGRSRGHQPGHAPATTRRGPRARLRHQPRRERARHRRGGHEPARRIRPATRSRSPSRRSGSTRTTSATSSTPSARPSTPPTTTRASSAPPLNTAEDRCSSVVPVVVARRGPQGLAASP